GSDSRRSSDRLQVFSNSPRNLLFRRHSRGESLFVNWRIDMPCRMVLAAVLLLSLGLPCWAAETENGALPARILGIVVDDEGRTLAGAKLSLFRDVYTVTPRIWEPVGEPVTSDE